SDLIVTGGGMTALAIAKRFCGPPHSANGGYFCGLVASLSPDTVTVRLMKPPPLATPLEAETQADGAIVVRHGTEVVAQARLAEPLALDTPVPPSYLEALDASVRY